MTRTLLEVGVAQRISPGEKLSGDRYILQQSATRALLGVIDGLGHGEEAASAAEAAQSVLDAPAGQSVGALMLRCHERLRHTRGAAVTLVDFDATSRRLEWIGVGNVVAVLLHPEGLGKLCRTELFVRAGVAGKMLPSTTTASAHISGGDVLVAATDGIHPRFIDDIERLEPPQQLAERLLARHQKGHDDALVVVVRIVRDGP